MPVPQSSINSSNVSGNITSLTLPEADEKKEISSMELKAQQVTAADASSSLTISTISPNSVKAQPPTSLNINVNHSFNNSCVTDKIQTSAVVLNLTDTTSSSDNFSNIQVVSNCNSSNESTAIINTTTGESVAASEESEVTEPLLVDEAKNSTNSNTNDYSGSEKDALIIISSN